MGDRIQHNIELPRRVTPGGDTQPPKTRDLRGYVMEMYRYFGWEIPPQWQSQSTPEPEFSEPEASAGDEPKKKVTRIRVTK